jgi:Domain of unknown function (DUF6268)
MRQRSAFHRLAVAIGFCGLTALAAGQDAVIQPIVSYFQSGEYLAEETYVGEAGVKRGRHSVEDFDESDSILRFVFAPRIGLGVLRFGAEWERFAFGFPHNAALPRTLQSASLVLGLDTQLSDSILIRIEATPGVYDTGFDHLSDDFNMPFVVGGTYIYTPNVQFILGVGVDIERKYPVIPAAGLRWQFARQWVANAVLPTPRLEYQWNRDLTLYLGADVKETNYRVDDHFGDRQKRPELNHAVLTYSEVRTGTGLDWKIAPSVTLTAEAGYQPYRSFDFFRTDIRFHQSGSAPYGMVSLHGAF